MEKLCFVQFVKEMMTIVNSVQPKLEEAGEVDDDEEEEEEEASSQEEKKLSIELEIKNSKEVS